MEELKGGENPLLLTPYYGQGARSRSVLRHFPGCSPGSFFFSWGRCWLKENKVVVVVDVVTSANERMDDKQRALTDGCVLRTRQLKRRTVK